MSGEGEREPDGAVPAELLRAGVYVPGTREELSQVVRRCFREGGGADEAVLSAVAEDPVLLDEVVGRVSAEFRRRRGESVLAVRDVDLLLAAPVARECAVPLRRVPSGVGERRSPVEDGASLPRPQSGERMVGVAGVYRDEPCKSALERSLRGGGDFAGYLAVTHGGGESPGGVWYLVEPPVDSRESRESEAGGPGERDRASS